jgi:hypothetical protein
MEAGELHAVVPPSNVEKCMLSLRLLRRATHRHFQVLFLVLQLCLCMFLAAVCAGGLCGVHIVAQVEEFTCMTDVHHTI